MLMYGQKDPREFDPSFEEHGCIFNITSLKEGYNKLNMLVPMNSMGYTTDRDYDIAYANYIFNNDAVFVEFFIIIYYLYIGKDVYLIYSNEDWSENIIESLLKLIQQRYGYNAYLINEDEDYIYSKMNDSTYFNGEWGLYNLDIDKNRFSYAVQNYILNFGKLPYMIEGFIVNE